MWTCLSPGCDYKGVQAIHFLNLESKRPEGHLTAAELADAIERQKQAEREAWEKETVVLQAELPVSLFEGMAVSDIFQKVIGLVHLLTFADRLVIQDYLGNVYQRSPACVVSQGLTAFLTIRWPVAYMEGDFWRMARKGYEAITMANEVRMDFPNYGQVVLKDRRHRLTPMTAVPVPVSR